jgi:hypothetical protein
MNSRKFRRSCNDSVTGQCYPIRLCREEDNMRLLSIALATTALLAASTAAQASPIASGGFSISTFASGPLNTSGADSVVVVGNRVYVGYGNGASKTGGSGASTIAEYNTSGTLLNTTSVAGHNDGLRYDPSTGKLWAIQNEDGNPDLVLITPNTLAQSAPFAFSAVPHGGGYDDAIFVNGKAYVSNSNPQSSPNTAPALSQATLGVGVVNVTGVLAGNASATAMNAGAPTTLNLQDPDSINITQDGRVVLDSQGDSLLLFISHIGTAQQTVGALLLQNGVMADDTAFAGRGDGILLVADKVTNIVYEIRGHFGFNVGYSALQDATGTFGFIGALNADGSYNNIVTGMGDPGGEAFLAPEPASLSVAGGGLLFWLVRRRAKR